MRRTFLGCLGLLLTASLYWPELGNAAGPWCFNFRATSGFVTDGPNCSPQLGEAYPTIYSNGGTAGWDSSFAANMRDRNAGLDARLAGIAFSANVDATKIFTIDLTTLSGAGTYAVVLAAGDDAGAQLQSIIIKDNGTLKLDLTNGGSGFSTLIGQYMDIAGTVHTSAANWVTNGSVVATNITFASTIFQVEISAPSAALLSTTINHIKLTFIDSSSGMRNLLLLGVQ